MTPGLAVLALIPFAVIAVLIVVLRAVAKAKDRRYRSGLLAWAAARNWACREGGGGEWAALLPAGEGRRAVEAQLDGARQGRPVTVAHYSYQTTSTGTDSDGNRRTSTTTHALTVVVVRLAARYPAVALEHRGLSLGWGLAVSRAVGRQPADLTGTREFDRRYRVRAAAPAGSTLVTPQLISAYLASDLPPWQLSGDHLVITWPGPIRVDDLDQKVSQALTIAGLLDAPATRP